MKKMYNQLMELLNIHGVSSDEGKVRDYLKPILEKSMDEVVVDSYGNLLATKKIGNGKGSTVLLSAHMDTVRGVLADRKILTSNDGDTITSNKGALGADDRAGIAIILQVLRNVKNLSFQGTLKIAFSREEEIGCIGAGQIDPKWYSDVDLAIVVDRKGNRDIVTGCYSAFCSDAVGNFFEGASEMQGMNWKAVQGGISDATVFSEQGIHSVNLSAGYRHEHTDKEYVVFSDMMDTVKLILQALALVNTFSSTFGNVPKHNKWVKAYTDTKSYYNYDYYTEEDFKHMFQEDIYAEIVDPEDGDTFVYEAGNKVVIEQCGNEIVLSKESLKYLVEQLMATL